MPTPINSELHSLLVNPRNSSLVLGAADYLTHRPAQWALRKATGNPALNVPSALSPAKWGETAARAGEKVDYTVGNWLGHARKEDIKLEPEHIKRIKDTLQHYEGSSDAKLQQHGASLRQSLDNLIREHSHSDLDLAKVLTEHGRNPSAYAHTLHGVAVPGVGGELGKKVKNFSTDTATLVGSGTIMNQIHQAEGLKPQEGAQNMDPKIARIQEALTSLEKAAAILADIPKRDEALKRANELCASGAIATDEIDKYAAVFYGSPEASDVLAQTVQRIAPAHAKSARLGEVISDVAGADGGFNAGRGTSFDDFCLSQLNR
jgi:hypothetical protein